MRFFVFLFLQTLVFFAAAQSIDVGISLGGSNYSGDLTPNAIAAIKQTGLAGGIHLRYDFSNAVAFKLQYMRLSVKGDDSYGKQDWYRLRNASFYSAINEVSLLGQANIMGLFYEEPRVMNFYLTLGASYFNFNPKRKYNGQVLELRELGTEGQGLPGYKDLYDLSAFALTMGMGVRYFLNSNLALTVEYITRKTRTDFLDDVSGNYIGYDIIKNARGDIAAEIANKYMIPNGSQRANEIDKDWFHSLMLTASWHFGADFRQKKIRFRKRGINCPSVK
ncbi:MAG TPA: DUF6089 family protein [Saprospiraceae bacterium]|nr:DUF6089 family protein [Saprospiraceae bacterium]